MPTLTFLGAARTVTGSKHLLDTGSQKVLVDAGLFQGGRDLRERNWERMPVDPAELHAVILTHAHIDHSGYLPRLVADGFRGRIFCTPGTADLCRLVLPDSGRLQEEDARRLDRCQPDERDEDEDNDRIGPLYTEADAFRAITQLQPVGYQRPIPVASGVEVEFINAGHLLGSAYARVSLRNGAARDVVFGGDLGRYDRPVLPDPTPVPKADVLLIESTYGDTNHDADDDGVRLEKIIKETVARGGRVIIPAFAIGRVEEVIYWLKRLEEQGRIPELPVYVDSPMAREGLAYYTARQHELDPDVRATHGEVSKFSTARFRTVTTAEESQDLCATHTPAIIVSSSGMANGGRVVHHLKAALPDPRNTVLFVGYQAAGTRGRQLISGTKEVHIHGQSVRVAANIELIDSMSAHADQGEMLRWLQGFAKPPETTYLVHGEEQPMAKLKAAVEERYGWNLHMPEQGETVEL
jgi:metallo-beta-lactamase family protein